MMNIWLANAMIVFYLYIYCEKLMVTKRIIGLEILLFLLCLGSSYVSSIDLRYVVVVLGIVGYVFIKGNHAGLYKLLMSVIFIVCLVVSEVVGASLMHSMMEISASDYRVKEYTMLLIMVGCIFFVCLYVVGRVLRLYKYLPKYTWMIMVLPITSIVLLLNLEDYFGVFKQDVFVVLGLFGVLFSNIIVFYLFFKLLDMYVLEKEMHRLENRCMSLSNLYSASASFLHDVTNRVFYLNKLDGDALKYEVSKLCTMLFQQFRSKQTICIALQNSISKYESRLIEYGISLKVDMDYVEFDNSEIFDCLLEMGIVACSSVDERFITIKSTFVNQCVVLRMCCAGKCKEIDEIRRNVDCSKVFYEWNGFSEITMVFHGVDV